MKKLTTEQLVRIAVVCGAAALALTLLVSWHGAPLPGDVRIMREFQGVDVLQRNEGWINPLGSLEWQLGLVIAAICVAAAGPTLGIRAGSPKQRTEAIWIVLIALLLRVFTIPLKSLAQADRPSVDFNLRIAEDFPGYGFPSGHVYGDVLIFGAIAAAAIALFGRLPGSGVRTLCIAVIVLSGPMRMVVGAHWPVDVAGGYLWGMTALCLAVLGARRLTGAK